MALLLKGIIRALQAVKIPASDIFRRKNRQNGGIAHKNLIPKPVWDVNDGHYPTFSQICSHETRRIDQWPPYRLRA
ncbi:MAG: hypothetical protein H6575_12925 [Lewinellaceae bacterium]|nr:hypothetical protein [Lewinellaceae bacterium]